MARMAKSVTTKDLAGKWAEVYKELESYLENDSIEYGNKASVGLDMLDLALASLAKQGLLSVVNIKIVGATDNSRKTIQYTLTSVYDEDLDETRQMILKTDNDEIKL